MEQTCKTNPKRGQRHFKFSLFVHVNLSESQLCFLLSNLCTYFGLNLFVLNGLKITKHYFKNVISNSAIVTFVRLVENIK